MLICYDHRTGSGCGHQNRSGARHCNQCGLTLRFALELQDAGSTVGRYEIVRVIGHGGSGAVYEARLAGRPVALKETFDPQGMRSFVSEFEVLSRLSHPHLPRYDEIFEAQGNGYLQVWRVG